MAEHFSTSQYGRRRKAPLPALSRPVGKNLRFSGSQHAACAGDFNDAFPLKGFRRLRLVDNLSADTGADKDLKNTAGTLNSALTSKKKDQATAPLAVPVAPLSPPTIRSPQAMRRERLQAHSQVEQSELPSFVMNEKQGERCETPPVRDSFQPHCLLHGAGEMSRGTLLTTPRVRRATPATGAAAPVPAPPTPTSRWSSQKVVYTELLNALNGASIDILADAVAQAHTLKMTWPELGRARDRLRDLQELKDGLNKSLSNGSIEEIEHVLAEGKRLRVVGDWATVSGEWHEFVTVQNRLNKLLDLRDELGEATAGSSIESLVKALVRAQELSARWKEVSSAEERLEELKGLQHVLESLLDSVSLEDLKCIVSQAQEAKLTESSPSNLGTLLRLTRMRIRSLEAVQAALLNKASITEVLAAAIWRGKELGVAGKWPEYDVACQSLAALRGLDVVLTTANVSLEEIEEYISIAVACGIESSSLDKAKAKKQNLQSKLDQVICKTRNSLQDALATGSLAQVSPNAADEQVLTKNSTAPTLDVHQDASGLSLLSGAISIDEEFEPVRANVDAFKSSFTDGISDALEIKSSDIVVTAVRKGSVCFEMKIGKASLITTSLQEQLDKPDSKLKQGPFSPYAQRSKLLWANVDAMPTFPGLHESESVLSVGDLATTGNLTTNEQAEVVKPEPEVESLVASSTASAVESAVVHVCDGVLEAAVDDYWRAPFSDVKTISTQSKDAEADQPDAKDTHSTKDIHVWDYHLVSVCESPVDTNIADLCDIVVQSCIGSNTRPVSSEVQTLSGQITPAGQSGGYSNESAPQPSESHSAIVHSLCRDIVADAARDDIETSFSPVTLQSPTPL